MQDAFIIRAPYLNHHHRRLDPIPAILLSLGPWAGYNQVTPFVGSSSLPGFWTPTSALASSRVQKPTNGLLAYFRQQRQGVER